jgi:hypothetical protein
MRCPKCQFVQGDGLSECLKCGVVFAKLESLPAPATYLAPPADDDAVAAGFAWRDLLLTVPTDVHPVIVAAKALLVLILVIWGARFMWASIESNAVGESFMHLVNLPFHEAGHIIFSPFGKLIQTLGGSLGQLLMPAVCLAVLLLRTRDAFGAAVAQWWLGQSFMDMAPYINDARALKLILLGGVTGKDVIDYHDWEYILRKLGMLKLDHALAYAAQFTGIVLMTAALFWAAANLWVQWKSCQASTKEPTLP